MSNLQTYYHFKLDFLKVDQHTGDKWLIHGTKRHKDNQLQSLEWYGHKTVILLTGACNSCKVNRFALIPSSEKCSLSSQVDHQR